MFKRTKSRAKSVASGVIAMAKADSFAAIVYMPGRIVNSGTVFVENGSKVSLNSCTNSILLCLASCHM